METIVSVLWGMICADAVAAASAGTVIGCGIVFYWVVGTVWDMVLTLKRASYTYNRRADK